MAAILIVLSFITLFIYGFMEMTRVKFVADWDPKVAFEGLVCDPMPESVSNIHARGIIMFTGGSASIRFEISPEDVDKLIEDGEFRPIGGGLPDWLREKHPDFNTDNAMRLRRGDREMDDIILYICGDRTKCWFVASYM